VKQFCDSMLLGEIHNAFAVSLGALTLFVGRHEGHLACITAVCKAFSAQTFERFVRDLKLGAL